MTGNTPHPESKDMQCLVANIDPLLLAIIFKDKTSDYYSLFLNRWFKRQGSAGVARSVTSGVDRDLKFIGGSLFISRLDKSQHEGFWTCQAKNDLGYDNKTVKLTVTGYFEFSCSAKKMGFNEF